MVASIRLNYVVDRSIFARRFMARASCEFLGKSSFGFCLNASRQKAAIIANFESIERMHLKECVLANLFPDGVVPVVDQFGNHCGMDVRIEDLCVSIEKGRDGTGAAVHVDKHRALTNAYLEYVERSAIASLWYDNLSSWMHSRRKLRLWDVMEFSSVWGGCFVASHFAFNSDLRFVCAGSGASLISHQHAKKKSLNECGMILNDLEQVVERGLSSTSRRNELFKSKDDFDSLRRHAETIMSNSACEINFAENDFPGMPDFRFAIISCSKFYFVAKVIYQGSSPLIARRRGENSDCIDPYL